MNLWFVYIVRCCDDSLYCGVALDLARRISEHNTSTRGSKYTRSRRPVKLAWWHPAVSKRDALRLEVKIKKMTKAAKERMVRLGAPEGEWCC